MQAICFLPLDCIAIRLKSKSVFPYEKRVGICTLLIHCYHGFQLRILESSTEFSLWVAHLYCIFICRLESWALVAWDWQLVSTSNVYWKCYLRFCIFTAVCLSSVSPIFTSSFIYLFLTYNENLKLLRETCQSSLSRKWWTAETIEQEVDDDGSVISPAWSCDNTYAEEPISPLLICIYPYTDARREKGHNNMSPTRSGGQSFIIMLLLTQTCKASRGPLQKLYPHRHWQSYWPTILRFLVSIRAAVASYFMASIELIYCDFYFLERTYGLRHNNFWINASAN